MLKIQIPIHFYNLMVIKQVPMSLNKSFLKKVLSLSLLEKLKSLKLVKKLLTMNPDFLEGLMPHSTNLS